MERFFGQIPMGADSAQTPWMRHGMGRDRARTGFLADALRGWIPADNGGKVMVSGTLVLAGGHIAVTRDGKTYYPVNLYHLAGFVDGFKEGAEVKVEGSAYPLPDGKNSFMLAAAKLTLNGKEYAFMQA